MKKKQMMYLGFFLLIIYILLQSIMMYGKYTSARNELAKNAIILSKIIAKDINPKEYKEIVDTKEKNYNYYKLQQKIEDIKKISGAKYVYIKNKLNENELEYIIDADGECLGEVDVNEDNEAFKSVNSISFGSETAKWGGMITGFTPIIDEDKNVIGIVGVDYEFGINITSVKSQLMDGLKNTVIMTILLIVFIIVLYIIGKEKDRNVIKHYGNLVHSLTIMLSKKSDYTWKHSENVAKLSEPLANKFFKDKKKVEIVKWASLLHDIGKIGISSNILDKPSRLTNEEFDKIKEHPIFSKEMLGFTKDNALFDDNEVNIISDIAQYHHERWDGKGYPCGLKGEDIPFMARIVSVVDAYEAMTAERPYKKPMSKENAVNQIISCSGTQFDPEIVAKFLECIEEGKI